MLSISLPIGMPGDTIGGKWTLSTSFFKGKASGVMTVSHLIMPGSAETTEGVTTPAGTTNERINRIAARTPGIPLNLVFIGPPRYFNTGSSDYGLFPDLTLCPIA
jgi:hypothetical protein